MNSVDDPKGTAKKPAELTSRPSHMPPVLPTTEERVLELLQEISSSIQHLDVRMETLEGRLGATERNQLEADEASAKAEQAGAEFIIDPAAPHSIEGIDLPNTDPPPPSIPGLALRSDGKVLLSVAYLKGAELEGRERWEGVILNVAEAWDAIDAVSDGCDDAASRVAGHILWRGKRQDEPEGSGGDGQE